MTPNRERRTNLGRSLSWLLENEKQDDEFYNSTYGGIRFDTLFSLSQQLDLNSFLGFNYEGSDEGDNAD